jgi:hypothetical protein
MREIEIDDFYEIKERMIKNNVFEVVLCKGCDKLKNNNLGIYCINGTRRIRILDNNVVCMDCDENRIDRIEITKNTFENLESNKIVNTLF